VDDNVDAATSMAAMLDLMGNETYLAHDGLAAVKAAEVYRPDVILLDIGLPKLNGYDVARKIRRMPFGKRAFLIAVSGWGQLEDRHRSSDAGFNMHLVKPVNPSELVKLLNGFTWHQH
jgi:DNA-binding response OmpR family regulator